MKDIEVRRSEVNQERYRARLDERQLHTIIVEAVAKAAGLSLEDKRVHVTNVYVSTRDSSSGRCHEAMCELVVDRLLANVSEVAQ